MTYVSGDAIPNTIDSKGLYNNDEKAIEAFDSFGWNVPAIVASNISKEDAERIQSIVNDPRMTIEIRKHTN